MASILKRVSEPTERTITAIAETEGRTFVAQLDRVVDAGLQALGYPSPHTTDPTPPKTTKGKRKATNTPK